MHFRFPTSLLTGLLMVGIMVLVPGLRPVSAQDGPPSLPVPAPLIPPGLIMPELASPADYVSAPGLQAATAAHLAALNPSAVDSYGYSLSTSDVSPGDVSYAWIDAFAFNQVNQPGCQKLSVTGLEDSKELLFSGGKSFPFYENNYNSVFASTEGYLSLGQGSARFINTPLPLRAFPNNLIAAFWDDLSIDLARYPQSGLYTCQTDDYVVIEWHQAVLYQAEDQGTATFEVVLYWNGDIKVQYQAFGGDIGNATTGIEDVRGRDGLLYQFNEPYKVTAGTAILFERPDPQARVNLWPAYQGKFATYTAQEIYEPVEFSVNLVNTGNQANPPTNKDTYTITASSSTPDWQIQPPALLDNYQVTLNPGESKDFIVIVQPPSTAKVGAATTITVRAQSAIDPTRSKQVYLQVSVPAPFVQSYWENDADRLVFSMIERARSEQKMVKDKVQNSGSLAVVRRPIGYAYFWDEKRAIPNSNIEVNEILFSLLDLKGAAQGQVRKLADHGSPQQFILDSNVAVAVAPNGRIGVLWLRETGPNRNTLVSNLYFAVLDPTGQFISAPAAIPLTSNTTPHSPAYRELRITATTDSRFVLAWREQVTLATATSNSIIYQVFNSSGGSLLAATPYRLGPAGGSDLFFAPALSGLSGNRFMMVWGRKIFDPGSPSGGFYMTEYSVFDSRGKPLQNPQTVTGIADAAGRVDMIELFDGRVALAIPYGHINLVMLEYDPQIGAYAQKGSPVVYTHPQCQTLDERHVSLAATQNNQAVLTWTCYSLAADQNKEGISPYQSELFYALVGSDGKAVTPPQIFYTSADEQDPLLHINQHGYSVSSHPRLKVGVVDLSLFAPEMFQTAPYVAQEVPLYYANLGMLPAINITLKAIVDSRLQVKLDSIQPAPTLINGNTIQWVIPTVNFLDSGEVKLTVVGGSQADPYTIQWSIGSNEIDDEVSDNSGQTLLKVETYVPYHPPSKVYLPITRR